MITTIGNGIDTIIIERDPYDKVLVVRSKNPLIKPFPSFWREKTIFKYKHKFGTIRGLKQICRAQIRHFYEDFLPEEKEQVWKAYLRLKALSKMADSLR